jgi:hypothetical protein
LFGTVQDITERKRVEEALKQSQFYLSEGQRLAHMGSWASSNLGVHWSDDLGICWSEPRCANLADFQLGANP